MNSGSRKITRDSQEQRKQRFETTKKVEFCLQSEYPPSLWTISSKYSFNWLTTQNYITGHSGPLSFTIAVRARSLCLGPIVFMSSDVACICHWMPDIPPFLRFGLPSSQKHHELEVEDHSARIPWS
jgi:hypothetical protein